MNQNDWAKEKIAKLKAGETITINQMNFNDFLFELRKSEIKNKVFKFWFVGLNEIAVSVM